VASADHDDVVFSHELRASSFERANQSVRITKRMQMDAEGKRVDQRPLGRTDQAMRVRRMRIGASILAERGGFVAGGLKGTAVLRK